MRSRRLYEYLAVMKKIENNSRGVVKLRDISRAMNIKPASAHEYLEKLSSSGYVEKIGRGEYRLSRRGEQELILRMWAHGVIETYLHKILGIDPDKACLIASKIDYIMPLDAVEKLYAVLGYPKKCPHNHSIPHKEHGLPSENDEYLLCFIYNISRNKSK
ncbi:MAG: metal-dependent transcriptional regulator [Sulfolobales archaeon]